MSEVNINRGLIAPVKNTTDRRLIIRILAYSAIKIRANIPLLYSTLNPDTSSDSPSAKSNGVRLVSAKLVMNHIIANGLSIIIIQDIELIEIADMSIWLHKIRAANRIRDILTSYEIVWATPRRAPRSAYLEFDLHPAINVVYTFILETHRKYKAPNDKKIAGWKWGKIAHNISVKIRPNTGAAINGDWFIMVGLDCSFVNNFMASANGCGSPASPTLLGPLRSWK
jgi:hypothetical protein